jgi:hypothetical protein
VKKKKKNKKNKKKKNNKEKKWICLLWKKGIQAFYWGAVPTDNWILIFFNYSVDNSISNI